MKISLTRNKELYNYCEPYIIAEIGSNHNGDMELARQLIERAAEAGADCVKFQSWSKDVIFSKKVYEDNYFLSDDYRDRDDFTLEEIVDKFSISEEQLLEMEKVADGLGLDCTSTPFSRREVDFLVDGLKAEFIKVASMDVTNYPFLSYIAGKGLPVVLSTGLSSLGEIDKAVRTMEEAGNDRIVLLHCVAMYPPADDQVNLRNIETLMRTYPYPVGFSDHSLGTSIPLASVALGACLVEKHFTLDKEMFGWDHKISADFGELGTLVKGSKKVQKALGSYMIAVPEDEEKIRAFRRSVVAARDIKAGETLTGDMLDFKRPGDGLPPEAIDYIVGKKAQRDIAYDELIGREDF